MTLSIPYDFIVASSRDNIHLTKTGEAGIPLLYHLRKIEETNGRLFWNRLGETRYVPVAVIRDAIELYDWWVAAPDHYQAQAPVVVGRIYWVDTEEIRQPNPSP